MRPSSFVAGAVALAASLAVVVPANADSVRHRDARRDVYETPSGGGEATRVRARETDIKRVSAKHTRKVVRMEIEGFDLSKRSGLAGFMIQTEQGDGYDYTYAYRKVGRFAGMPRFSFHGQTDECRGVRHSVSRKRDTAKVVVPRRCLGRASRVRVGFFLLDRTSDNSQRSDNGLTSTAGISGTKRWLSAG